MSEQTRGEHDNQPQRVAEPARPAMIETGGDAGLSKNELEIFLTELKYNFKAVKVLAEPVAKFAQIIEIRKTLVENRDASQQDDPAYSDFFYDRLVKEVAEQLVWYKKTDQQDVTDAVHRSISLLIDLLIVELQKQTPTCVALAKAIQPIFDPNRVFYQNNDQAVLEEAKKPEPIEETKEQDPEPAREPEPDPQPEAQNQRVAQSEYVDLWNISDDEKDWRNRLCQGVVLDAVISDEVNEIAGWVKAEVIDVIGDRDGTNLGDLTGENVKSIQIEYINQGMAQQKHYRCDSSQIAQYDSKTSDEIWRYSLKEGDDVDFLKSNGDWETGVVTYIDEIEGLASSPMMEVGFRIFRDGQSTLKSNKSKIPVFSIRVQKPYTMQSDSGYGEHVWQIGE